jgi:hypothetical protein
MNFTRRLSLLTPAVVLVLAMNTLPAFAQHVYWGGGKVRHAGLSGTAPNVLWNVPAGEPVAVDTTTGRIYWADSSTLPNKIMYGNLNGTGTPTPLLTTLSGSGGPERVDIIQIDVGQQMIYWADRTTLHIYRSPINAPSPQMLPLAPATIGTLRDIALDTRPSNPKLYWLTSTHVYRCNLDGTSPQQLPNALGNGILHALAIDTCNDQFIALGRSGGNPYFSVIVRADLANAGNVTTILQDPPWPPSNIGQDTRDIALDLNGGMMYWTADHDVNYLPTVRRATLSGTNVQVVALGNSSSWYGAGVALDSANMTCPTVGVNKDLQNNTGQIANNIEILLAGTPNILNHYDGYPANVFSSFTATPAPGGNTMLTWSAPNNDVQPGQIAHVGFNLSGASVNILGVFWTRDDTTSGCASQVSTNTHLWGSPGSQVIYANNCLSCKSVTRERCTTVSTWCVWGNSVEGARLSRREFEAVAGVEERAEVAREGGGVAGDVGDLSGLSAMMPRTASGSAPARGGSSRTKSARPSSFGVVREPRADRGGLDARVREPRVGEVAARVGGGGGVAFDGDDAREAPRERKREEPDAA